MSTSIVRDMCLSMAGMACASAIAVAGMDFSDKDPSHPNNSNSRLRNCWPAQRLSECVSEAPVTAASPASSAHVSVMPCREIVIDGSKSLPAISLNISNGRTFAEAPS
jgi:hypothetical protein